MNPEKPVFTIIVLSEAEEFIKSLDEKDRSKILFAINDIKMAHFDIVYVKTLRYKIKELIVKKYRLLFFIEDCVVYVTRGFIKKTNKTPIEEIEHALRQYAKVIAINQKNNETD